MKSKKICYRIGKNGKKEKFLCDESLKSTLLPRKKSPREFKKFGIKTPSTSRRLSSRTPSTSRRPLTRTSTRRPSTSRRLSSRRLSSRRLSSRRPSSSPSARRPFFNFSDDDELTDIQKVHNFTKKQFETSKLLLDILNNDKNPEILNKVSQQAILDKVTQQIILDKNSQKMILNKITQNDKFDTPKSILDIFAQKEVLDNDIQNDISDILKRNKVETPKLILDKIIEKSLNDNYFKKAILNKIIDKPVVDVKPVVDDKPVVDVKSVADVKPVADDLRKAILEDNEPPKLDKNEQKVILDIFTQKEVVDKNIQNDISDILKQDKNTINDFEVVSGKYVSNDRIDWVYDVKIKDKYGLVCVVGFTKNNREGAIFWENDEMMTKYEEQIDKIKMIAKSYLNDNILVNNNFQETNYENLNEFLPLIKKNYNSYLKNDGEQCKNFYPIELIDIVNTDTKFNIKNAYGYHILEKGDFSKLIKKLDEMLESYSGYKKEKLRQKINSLQDNNKLKIINLIYAEMNFDNDKKELYIQELKSNCTIPSVGQQFLYKIIENLGAKIIKLYAISPIPYLKMGFTIDNTTLRNSSRLTPMIANFHDIKEKYDLLNIKLDIKIKSNKFII